MSNSDLACFLIKAANLAYGINKAGNNFEPDYKHLLDELKFKETPKIFQSQKDDGIDACYFGETEEIAILAFRGTLPPSLDVGVQEFLRILLDWLNDAKLVQVPGKNLPGLVHQGFLSSLDNLWPGIDNFKIAESIQNKKLYITGHSKGGGLTYLAAMRLLSAKGIKPAGVYSYAAPRVGNAEFALSYDANLKALTQRYEFQDDIVPHLPPHTGSWLSALRGAEKAAAKLTPLLADLESMEAKSGFDLLLNRIEQILGRMSNHGDALQNYVSAGVLRFIDWQAPPELRADSWGLTVQRDMHLAELLLTFQYLTIIKDHSGSGGYQQFPCTGNV